MTHKMTKLEGDNMHFPLFLCFFCRFFLSFFVISREISSISSFVFLGKAVNFFKTWQKWQKRTTHDKNRGTCNFFTFRVCHFVCHFFCRFSHFWRNLLIPTKKAGNRNTFSRNDKQWPKRREKKYKHRGKCNVFTFQLCHFVCHVFVFFFSFLEKCVDPHQIRWK